MSTTTTGTTAEATATQATATDAAPSLGLAIESASIEAYVLADRAELLSLAYIGERYRTLAGMGKQPEAIAREMKRVTSHSVILSDLERAIDDLGQLCHGLRKAAGLPPV